MTGRYQALRLERIGLNVRDLDASIAFYRGCLGFIPGVVVAADPAMARLLGVTGMRAMELRRGRQRLELTCCDPLGQPYPAAASSNDLWFQHCALVSDDIRVDYQRLCGLPEARFTPISRHGPQLLPGGIVAFKFRDPDGHPLELIQFPHGDARTSGGIDHSAIAVADADRSASFYAETLGLALAARQVNTGPAQDALDDLDGVRLAVLALTPVEQAPHLELLGYHTPRGRVGMAQGADIAASRLVFSVATLAGAPGAAQLADGGSAVLLHDPDGHALVLVAGGTARQDGTGC